MNVLFCGEDDQSMFAKLNRDIQAIKTRDPAARNFVEILLFYPGLHALLLHRIAHFLYNKRLYFLARGLAFFSRWITDIEIHPAAKIGYGVFIDHGAGVVIGETTEIGDNCTIYQGATLGGTGKDRGKRHPTIGKNVVISAGAKVLGPFKVGDYAKIGAGAVVLKEVPSYSTVVGVPGQIVRKTVIPYDQKTSHIDLDQTQLPDIIQEQFHLLFKEIHNLRHQLNQLEEKQEKLENISKRDVVKW
nr:serine O-acetyltransferase [Evansella caseinilytica]